MQRAEVASGLRDRNIFIQTVVRVLAVQEHSAEGSKDLLWAHLLPVLGHALLSTCTAPPKKYIKGNMAQKWEEKCPWPTASGSNSPCKAYRVWEHPNAIGLGAISNSTGAGSP